jgi:hypothetical protein
MVTKVYNNLPNFLKEIDDYKAFKGRFHPFYRPRKSLGRVEV